ncbi:UNVERIFIED_CONTAM: hypothetical protein FKN15_015045 [Acipenser sinensis]
MWQSVCPTYETSSGFLEGYAVTIGKVPTSISESFHEGNPQSHSFGCQSTLGPGPIAGTR